MEELFGRALDLPPAERSAFLGRECGEDAEMRREIESLLTADTRAVSFLEQPVTGRSGHPPVSLMESTVPDRIGQYQLLRLAGEGGMSKVYLALRADDEFQKRVALKVVRQDLDREDLVRRFRTERQILAGLDHPNIAKLLDGGTTPEGRPYFVMDFIDGIPIDRYCDENCLTVDQRLDLFQAVCSAAHYAHQNLVIHRDIKPSNILVTADGVPKLLDFGIAKILKPEQFAQQVEYTADWMRPMTPRYASPEQIQGHPVTTTCDVYSLGVLLYKLLTGHLPYRLQGQLPTEVGRAIVEQEAERPSSAVLRVDSPSFPRPEPDTPTTPEAVSQARATQTRQLQRQLAGDLDNVLLMALRKEPQRRYASVEQFAEDLRRYRQGLPVKARTDTLGYRSAKFVRRNWLPVAGAASFLVALTAFAIVMTVQAARIADERDEAERERDRAERVTAFLQEIFEVSDPGHSPGEIITAREILERGAHRIRRELTAQPEDRATMMAAIGNVSRGLGLYEQARPLLEEALTLRRSLYKAHNPRVTESLNDLGHLARLMGDLETADTLLRQALALRQSRLEQDPLSVVMSLNEIGVLFRLQGQHDQAEAHYRAALTLAQGIPGDHEEVADTHNNLGVVLLDLGMIEDAEAQFRDALAIARRVLGHSHPRVGRILSNLGVSLGMQRKYDDAESVLREALVVSREGLGDDHPRLVEALNNLGKLLQRKEQTNDAEVLFREAVEIARRRLGSDHPQTAHVVSNLAGLLRDQGDFAAAAALSREALAIRRERLGDGHVDLGRSQVQLGTILIADHNPEEAEGLLRQALDIFEQSLPGGHWRIANAQSILGHCLVALSRYEEAEPLLIEGYQGQAAIQGLEHPRTLAALRRVIALYEAWDRPQDATRYRALLPK
jgi:serine/threonine-protein kinase